MDYRRYVCSARERLQCVFISVGLTAILAWLFYRSWWGLLLLPVVCAWYTVSYRNAQRKKQTERLLYEFADTMQALSSALLAGYSMENAWRDAERELIELHGAESMMAVEVHRMNAAVRMNEPIEQVLAEFAGRSGCEEIESFAEIFAFAKRSGGDFAKIIRTTVKKLNGEIAVEQEIATVLAGKKLEGRLMNVMPLLILAYMTFTAGDFLDVLYGNTLGVCIMTAVLVGYAFTLKLSERILDIRI